MKSLLIGRNRTVILLLVVIFIFGLYVYMKMPRENNPDIQIPIISMFVGLPGIPVEDIGKLLAVAIENELRLMEGIKELKTLATDGGTHVILEFSTDYSNEEVLDTVCSRLSNIKSKLPAGAEPPVIGEINLSLFSMLNVVLVGHLPERTLTDVARK